MIAIYIIIFYIFSSLTFGNGAIPTVIAKVLLVMAALPYFSSKRVSALKPYIFWCLAFVSFCWLSLYWAFNRETGWYFVSTVSFVYICNVALAVLIINSEKPISYWLKVFMYSTLFMCVVFLFQHGLNYGEDVSRADTDININTIGMVSGVSCSLAVYFYMFDKKLKGKLGICFLVGIFGLIILLSASRKSLLIPIVVYSFFKLFRGKGIHFVLNIVPVLLVVSFSLWVVLNIPVFYEMIGFRLEGMFNGFFGNEEEMDGSTYTRILLVDFGKEIFAQRPWLGYGVCNFRAVYLSYFPGRHALYAHNNYIELLVDLGIVGLVLYYIFYIYLIVRLFEIAKKNNDYMAYLLFAIMVSMVFVQYGFVAYYSLFNNILLTIAACYVFIVKKKLSFYGI